MRPSCPRRWRRSPPPTPGHEVSYGADRVTARLRERVREHFGARRDRFPVFNGTGANVVGLRAMLRPWQGVVCAESAHLNVDEGGAPEAMAGIKLLTVADARRQAHPRARRAVDDADRRRARRAARGRLGHAVDRARHALHGRGAARARATTRTRTGCCSTSTARGWPTPPPRSTSALRRDHDRRRRRRRQLRRDEGRAARGRGGRRPQPVAGGRAALPAQAVDAARVEDALRLARSSRRC